MHVTKPSSRQRTTVCLFSFHPLLKTEFERVLPEEEFRLLFRRVDPDLLTNPEKLTVPRASAYVLESHRRAVVTEALTAAVTRRPGARVLVVAEKFTEANAFPLLRLGTKGLVTYQEVESHLGRALKVLAGAGFWVPRALLSRFVDSEVSAARRSRPIALMRRLSRREKEVMELLLENLSNKEIASELHISSRTAKFHVSNLLSKHGVRRRADLMLLAYSDAAARGATAVPFEARRSPGARPAPSGATTTSD
jgi:DNA-binding NarL/FixJ family response regulator